VELYPATYYLSPAAVVVETLEAAAVELAAFFIWLRNH
jgi:hypothetical protein